MSGGPRGALVDEVNGDSICDQIPLPHGHGSVNFRFSMIPSSLKFQLSAAPRVLAPFEKETSAEYGGDCAADRSLLGTWAHIADKSSRSRLCWLQLLPVRLTDHCITAHYSSFSLVTRPAEKPADGIGSPPDCLHGAAAS